jgi:ElaA protein
MIEWVCRSFDDLSVHELYAVMRLRSEVFVVEQNCVYLDPDGYDDRAMHLLGYADGELVAYARIFAPGIKYEEASIGRVITSAAVRGTGAGQELMREAVARCAPGPIRIGAQQYLERFYGSFGFVRVSEPYDEDGIAHVEMVRG